MKIHSGGFFSTAIFIAILAIITLSFFGLKATAYIIGLVDVIALIDVIVDRVEIETYKEEHTAKKFANVKG